MDPKEEIRAKLNIEDIVAEYIELRRAGRNFKALSPFSQEKTPSFMVSPEKQIWHDFSSNRGGDIFSFVMEMEGIDFRGALELLARKAGVDLSQYQNDKAKELHKKKQRLYDIMELATKFYEFALTKHATARAYWQQKRGFTSQTIQRFRLGYAPGDNSLSKFLLGRDFTIAELKSAGLVTQRASGPGDMFRERVMVPLADGQGRVVGFTARQLKDDKNAPKYINTPQTLLYDKGRQVFGLHLAKEAIRQKDYAVVVEGNLDVIASHQANESAVVATAGIAMTKEHLSQLARLTPYIKLAFDSDAPGLAATERAIAIAQEIGIELSIISMPKDYKDPDELIKKDVTQWETVIKDAQYAMDWMIDRHAALYDLQTAEGKRQFTTKTLQVVKKLQDAVEQEHYVTQIADKIATSREALVQKLQSLGEKTRPKELRAHHASHYKPDNLAYQDTFLAIAAHYPAARDVFRHLSPEDLQEEHRQEVARFLQSHSDTPLSDTPSSLQKWDTYVKIIVFTASEKFSAYSEADYVQEAFALAKRIKKEKLRLDVTRLSRELENAEQQNDAAQATDLRQKVARLIKEYRHA